jgi:regulatory protein YycH of two-component signal transduction system YycFG
VLERIKSVVLLALIAVCVQLTGLFWTRTGTTVPLRIVPVNPTPITDPQAPTSYIDLFAPREIFLHSQPDHYRFLAADPQYQELWQAMQQAVGAARGAERNTSISLKPRTSLDWEKAARESVEFRFSGPVKLSYWWLVASRLSLQKFPDDVYFDRILLPLTEPDLYLMNSRTEQFWSWQWSEQANAATLPGAARVELPLSRRMVEIDLPDGLPVAPGVTLYAQAVLPKMPEIFATLPVNDDNKQAVINQFFSIVPRMQKEEKVEYQEVVETYITARQQVLRLSSSGSIEYTAPPESETQLPTAVEQFERAFNFVLAHGGWAKNIITAGMQPLADAATPGASGHSFEFIQHYNGIPVLDTGPMLRIDVSPQGISRYQRKLYQVEHRGFFEYEVRSAREALQIAQPVLTKPVVDVYLAYYQRPAAYNPAQPFFPQSMYLYPVWVVEQADGQRWFTHAFKLLNDPGLIQGR